MGDRSIIVTWDDRNFQSLGGHEHFSHLGDRLIPVTWRTGEFQSPGGQEHSSHLEDRSLPVTWRTQTFQSPGGQEHSALCSRPRQEAVAAQHGPPPQKVSLQGSEKHIQAKTTIQTVLCYFRYFLPMQVES